MIDFFNTTVTGARHSATGKPCQDASLTWHDEANDITIAVVSDGHGGERYVHSDRGARFACEVALDVLKEMAADTGFALEELFKPANLHQLTGCIVSQWMGRVEAELNGESSETYGCTLIAYLKRGEQWMAMQIGDGSFVVQNADGEWMQPIPWDDRCFLNMTTSMCDRDAAAEFRFASSIDTGEIGAAFLVTDGIDGTLGKDSDLYDFFQQILNDMKNEAKGCAYVQELMPEILDHFSRVGCGDDMSIACVFNH